MRGSITSAPLLRDSAVKVAMHMMPGLFVDEKQDLKMFKQLFSDDNFKPDMLKIYPKMGQDNENSKRYSFNTD